MLFVEYKQMPFHTVDDSVRHCLQGYRWLLDQGWAPDQIAFAGDSAGGFFVYAVALSEAGAKVTLKTWAGQLHVFQLIAGYAPEAKQSLTELAAFIRSVTS